MSPSPFLPRRRDAEAEREFRSRELLSAADATVVLVDRQLRRLQAAADLYRERLEAGMDPIDESD